MTPYNPPDTPLDLLYLDDHLIAINKPSGLLSVPGRGPEKADCAHARVARLYPGACTIHRLDMATSGILLFARHKEAQRHMSRQFEAGNVEKRYIADVWGQPDPASGLIDLPLLTDWPNRPRQKVDLQNGKPSQTRYETLTTSETSTRLTLTPLTGRSHQLRVHLLSIGHPILGDALYAHPDARQAAHRLHLHAEHICFTPPEGSDTISISAAVPF